MHSEFQSSELSVSVPGKIMIAGEYAVLRGGSSLSAAVDAWLTLSIKPNSLGRPRVFSELWHEAKLLNPDLSRPEPEPLLDSLRDLQRAAVDVSVRSELQVAFGLGSSSAVRLAGEIGSFAYRNSIRELSPELVWSSAQTAWLRQKELQGFASGYDLVTQASGGTVLWSPDYSSWPGSVSKRSSQWLSQYIHPYVGGRGAPTTQVGGSVRQYLEEQRLWSELMACNENFIRALDSERLIDVIHANIAHRSLFEDAPFYPSALRNLLASQANFDRSWSFKTTGAGGEDAILLIGSASEIRTADEVLRNQGWYPLPHSFTDRGSHMSWKDSAL